jgi:hypothetical protein
MASILDNPIVNWAEEEAGAFLKHVLGDDFTNGAKTTYVETVKWLEGDAWHFFLNSLTDAIEWVNSAIVAFTPAAMTLAASTIHQITGIQIDAKRLGDIAQGAAGREQMIEVGAAFHPVLDQMFPIDVTAALTTDRSTRQWAIDNVNAYFGTNMLFQLRSLTIATVASFVPGNELRHLEGLHQSINWAYGFGWLSWTVMSAIMDVTTTKPLKEHYNRLIKPEDLTPQRAIQAYLTGQIDRPLLNQIMDNEGLRDDVRQIEIDLQEKDLSDSDLRTLWQEQRIDEAYLTKAFRLKSFGEERAGKTVELLKDERRLKLRDEWLTVTRSLFRDCVIEEPELRQALTEQHYTADESDWVVKTELAKRRVRTFLPAADMVKAIKKGLLDINDAANSLQCRGYTYDDMVVELLLKLEDKLPPCDDVKLEEKAMIQLLQALGTSLGISGKFLRPNVLKYLQCLNAEYLLLPPIAELTADKTTVVGADRVILTWKTQLATSATIEPLLGPVPLDGSTGVDVKRSQGFKLTAKSPIGTAYATVFIDVVPAPPIQPPAA